MAKILEGVKVLDFSRFISGPYASMLMADMGAEVVRVERPEGAEDRYAGETLPNGLQLSHGIVAGRNKRSITLRLQREESQDILRGLVEKADVCIHNFPPGTPECKMLAYDRLSDWNPQIIVAALSGFGQYGPYAQRPAFDAVVQAMSGMMSYTGFPDSPPLRTGIPAADWGTGAHALAGILAALYWRTKSGRGQFLDISMLDVMVSCMATSGVAADYRTLGLVREKLGNYPAHSFGGCFPTADGWFYMSLLSNGIWRRFLKVIDRTDLATDARFQNDMDRAHHREAISEVVCQWSLTRTTQEAVRILDEARIPVGWVNTVPDMMADPQVAARNMIVDIDLPGGLRTSVPGVVLKFSETPGAIERGTPLVGEDNEDVYGRWLGLSGGEVARLKREGVI